MNTFVLPTVRLTAVLCLLATTVSIGAPASLEAQETELRKSDIVRLLSGSTYTVVEVATIIRTNCLSFEPTERDYADFRDLGADASVVSAIPTDSPGLYSTTGPN